MAIPCGRCWVSVPSQRAGKLVIEALVYWAEVTGNPMPTWRSGVRIDTEPIFQKPPIYLHVCDPETGALEEWTIPEIKKNLKIFGCDPVDSYIAYLAMIDAAIAAEGKPLMERTLAERVAPFEFDSTAVSAAL